mmetsp:Transcript_37001/g.98580  ORF Transcript_37001/g.98580 Transcript_37001/m.98580 type:complete len:101 (+) Transcript_37001:266-568(+)
MRCVQLGEPKQANFGCNCGILVVCDSFGCLGHPCWPQAATYVTFTCAAPTDILTNHAGTAVRMKRHERLEVCGGCVCDANSAGLQKTAWLSWSLWFRRYC